MRLLLSPLVFLALTACESQPVSDDTRAPLVQVLTNADNSINELSAETRNAELNLILNSVFQSISENTDLVSTEPIERLREKEELLKQCSVSLESCNFTPEGYDITVNDPFLNIKYQYNQFSSYDTYYKYAVVDLARAKRLVWADIFTASGKILEKYNILYVQENEDYLRTFDLDNLTEDQEWEYEVIREHLDNRAPFKPEDLNNFELIFDSEGALKDIRFHYNGSGGHYKSILSDGSISFEVETIDALLSEDFKHLLKSQ